MKINPRQIERMMKQMGMQMSHIDAEEVIIKTPEKEIVISDPDVSKINLMGQETFQITGNVSERAREESEEEDLETIMEQTGVSRIEAKKTLEETKDLAEAILRLKKK
jgi:nascent polypeptide-associated complex subunit alpha